MSLYYGYAYGRSSHKAQNVQQLPRSAAEALASIQRAKLARNEKRMVFFHAALYKAASDSIRAAFSAGDASPILVTTLPGWWKPLCFRVGYAQWGLTLTHGNLTVEVRG